MAYTSGQIKQYGLDKGYIREDGGVKDDASAWALARDASQYGVLDKELDSAMGWAAGTARGWLDERGQTGMLKERPPTTFVPPEPSFKPWEPTRVEGPIPTGTATGATGTTTPTGTGRGRTWKPADAGSTGVAAAAPAGPVYQAPSIPDWAKTGDPKAVRGALSTYTSSMKEAPTFTVTSDMMTSNQLMKLLSADNPYITRARTRAAEYSNARGLMNSSIGAGAGEAAAIDAALPIAQADAAAHLQGGLAGFDAKVQYGRDENSMYREGALAALNHGFGLFRDTVGYQFQSGEKAADRALTRSENALDRSKDWDLANLQEAGANYRTDRQIGSNETLTREGWANDRSENALDRNWKSGENRTQREWQTGENQTDRDWKTGENQTQRDWQTGENQTQRDWQSSESDEDRFISRDRDARTTAGQLESEYARDLSNLENNTNLTPEERTSAINRLSSYYINTRLPSWVRQYGIAVADMWPSGFGVTVAVDDKAATDKAEPTKPDALLPSDGM